MTGEQLPLQIEDPTLDLMFQHARGLRRQVVDVVASAVN
jgi:hypothetical protein